MSNFFKIFSLIFTCLFVYAVVVQYNDPDSILWFILYGVAALASILFYLKKLPLIGAIVLFIGYVIGAISFWPLKFEGYAIGEGDIKNIEMARESSGLLICAVVMLVFVWGIKSIQKN